MPGRFLTLNNKPLWQTVSKAWATSKNNPEQYFFVSSAVEMLENLLLVGVGERWRVWDENQIGFRVKNLFAEQYF